MAEAKKSESASRDRDVLEEMLVAATVLCMQLGETAAADHVLEALRTLHYPANDKPQ